MSEKVKQALDLLEHLRKATLETDIDSMGGLVVTNESCFEKEINELKEIVNDFDKYYESQKDLIKGKDEYIAKLCNDRAELKEENKTLKNIIYGKEQLIVSASKELTELKEHEKELIAEQHRLFDLAKEQETELNELREFAKEIAKLPRFLEINHIRDTNYKIRNGKYSEDERCWLYQDIRCSTNDKVGWFLNERDGAMLFSKESAEKTIEKFKNWGFEGAEDLIIVLEYKQAHDKYVLFKKVVEKYGSH